MNAKIIGGIGLIIGLVTAMQSDGNCIGTAQLIVQAAASLALMGYCLVKEGF